MPASENEFEQKILDMGSWTAADGDHIPSKCPSGGQSSHKEYHNFNNYYSLVLVALVDAKVQLHVGELWVPWELPQFYYTAVNLTVEQDQRWIIMKLYTNAVLSKEKGISTTDIVAPVWSLRGHLVK